jgi:flagellin-specific chaperone FliS
MFIAEQKKRENIAEYLLYMWQLEDIMRAYEFDIDKIQKALIEPISHSDEGKIDARQWYMGLIEQMKSEGLEKDGHLFTNSELLKELGLFHSQLLKNPNELKYVEIYYKTLPFIKELRSKSKDNAVSEIEICFTALYGFLLLKLQKREISSDTATAIAQISNLLRSLSEKYHLQDNKGE